MSDDTRSEATPPALEALRRRGGQRLDPVHFRYLENLSQRLHAAPEPLRPLLAHTLERALSAYGERIAMAPGRPDTRPAPASTSTPLSALNRYIREAQQHTVHKGLPGDLGDGGEAGPEMKSVRRFRKAWSRMAAEDQLDHAFGRGPENAGPLNSHMLALRSLALMRERSPDYLRRFMAHLETLQWLDQVNQKYMAPEARPARRSRPKKS